MKIQSSKNDNIIVTQSSKEIYDELQKNLSAYHKVDAQKMAYYLRGEDNLTLEQIGNILGVSPEAVRKKYFKEEVSE
jgi:hypothetical protein